MSVHRFPKPGEMCCVAELAPGESGLRVGSVHKLNAIAAVRMDNWLRLCFSAENGETIGGLGGVWCRVCTVEVSGNVITLGRCELGKPGSQVAS